MKKQEYTPAQIIEKRENIIETIGNNWKLIGNFNIAEKGEKEKYDLKAVLKEIINKEKELVQTKVIMQAINMGMTNMSQVQKSTLFETIYMLSQVKERITKLKMIKTKKKESEIVRLTQTFVNARIVDAEKLKAKLELKLDKFNKKAKFSM